MSKNARLIILAVGLLVVAGAIYWYAGRSTSPLPDKVRYVCIATGEQFTFSWEKRPNTTPGTNPKTGALTLLPVGEVDGKLMVGGSGARALQDSRFAEVNRYVDPDTLEVLAAPRR